MSSQAQWLDTIYTFEFEDNFDYNKSTKWMLDNQHIPWIIVFFFYLPVIYYGPKWMFNRNRFNLRTPLLLWNTILAVFSLYALMRTLPEMIIVLRKHGFGHSICDNSFKYCKTCSFWTFLFVLSKIPELMDTVFIIFRKQKLIFLHVWHHATVLLFSWYIYAFGVAGARWFCTMNLSVHTIMYTYYALKALPSLIHIPKWCSMLVTTCQTVQMVGGTIVVYRAFEELVAGRRCDTNVLMSVSGLVIYVSYLILFSNFFYQTYIKATPESKSIDDSNKKKPKQYDTKKAQ